MIGLSFLVQIHPITVYCGATTAGARRGLLAGGDLMTHLYDDDFYAWTQQQAAAVRAGNWDEIDRENLAEEIEDLYLQGSHEIWQHLRELMV